MTKRVQGMVAVVGYAAFAVLVLGGCPGWQPSGPDQGDKADAGDSGAVPERPECSDRVTSCRLNCFKADLGRRCSSCCDDNGKACDRGESYSFNACQNL
jgi:hypothetical protein